MKKELMEKEVLCILDTRQIQKFMFMSNTMLDNLGASDLVLHILDDAILYALHHIDTPLSEDEYDVSMDPDAKVIPYFDSEKVKFQLIICTAGNAMFIARTGELAQKIIRKISRYYLEHSYSLNLGVAVTEKTGDFGRDIFDLYKNLALAKASSEISDPLGALPVAMREKNTGLPVIGCNAKAGISPAQKGSDDPFGQPAEYISLGSRIKREEVRSSRERVVTIDEIIPSAVVNGRKYRAVLHADGNNLGITIGGILQRTPIYEDGIRSRRQINKNIKDIYRDILDRTFRELRDHFNSTHGEDADYDLAFQLIHQGGDDINIICSADMAIPFVNFFYKNLDGAILWDAPGKRFPLYVCTGIAFIPEEMSYREGFRIAEECCDSAKTVAKKESNLRNGLAGNWMDFQICEKLNNQELSLMRKRTYITNEDIDLTLRPYCLDAEEKGTVYDYDLFIKRCEAIKELDIGGRDRQMLDESYFVGREEFNKWITSVKNRGTDLVGLLEKPLYMDSDKVRHAVWYDASRLAALM